MSRRVARAALLLASVWAARSVSALGINELPELIALDDRVVARLSAPEPSWSPDGAHLTVAGYSGSREPTVAVIPVDGKPPFVVPNLTSPRLAPAPHGSRIACWQRATPSPTGASRFQLAIFDPRLGVSAPLGGVAPFEAAPPIVWLSHPQRIITLRRQGEYTAVVFFDPVAGRLAPLVATLSGLGTVLREAATPGCVIVGTVGHDGETEYFLIDVTTGIASNLPEEETPGTLQGAASGGTPGLSPTGSLVASCRKDGLWVGPPDQPDARRILPCGELGAHDYAAASQPLWSPTEEHLVYTVGEPEGTLSEIRLVTLALEEIVCELFYAPGDTTPALGATVWVCMDLQLDEHGKVIEPKWDTLKAQLSVTSSPLEGASGLTVRARSVGLGAGVLKRLTGLSDPPGEMADERNLQIGPVGATPQTVLRAFTLPARHGLLAWSKDASTGKVRNVKVTRRALLLIGSPVLE